ncbi:MAG: hypothetical protein ACD_11C00116G0039 [uncultured bacterium]|nr:MAG: hypothetical protein ACD_11C00116G0039 [uncultured bacterium]HBR71218.1 hypothetical protein [Candidatus Moranbacteria bacterium]
MKPQQKIFSLFFIISFALLLGAIPAKKARAQLATVDLPALPSTIINTIQTAAIKYSDTIVAKIQDKTWIKDAMERSLLPILKSQLIQTTNTMTTNLLSGGNGGKPYIITDWRSYLYNDPAKKARTTVNSMLDNTLGMRSSSSGYTNPEYFSYLKKVSQNSVESKPLVLDITDYASNPQKDLFEGGNMIAFNKMLEPGNNPFTFSETYAQIYKAEAEKEKEIALNETSNGLLPKKDEQGRIMTPATVFEDAVNSASNMANNMITNATKTEELLSGIMSTVMSAATNSLKNGLMNSNQLNTLKKADPAFNYLSR